MKGLQVCAPALAKINRVLVEVANTLAYYNTALTVRAMVSFIAEPTKVCRQG